MKDTTLWKYVPPPGPLLSVVLIGLVLLSALLYYRAVKIQRFLEPALALSQPRNEFSKGIMRIIEKEFGTQPVKGLAVRMQSIVIEKSLLISADGTLRASAQRDLQKLARIFLALMNDDHLRSEINLVLIVGRFPSHGTTGATMAARMEVQRLAGFIQDALFHLEPELGIRFSTYFASAAQPIPPAGRNAETIEFRIIPSEFLHIEVLEKLEKYSM
jgi:hypothetical protein